jgi:hypothetical protein
MRGLVAAVSSAVLFLVVTAACPAARAAETAPAAAPSAAAPLAGRGYADALSGLLDRLQAEHAAAGRADWDAWRAELLPAARDAEAKHDPAAFARVLADLARRLRGVDGVSAYLPGSPAALPGWLERTPLFPVGLEGDGGARPGAVRLADGRVFVVSVREKTVAAACGVRPGDEVTEVGGRPVGAWLAERGDLIGGPTPQARTADALSFLLRSGESLRLTLRDPGTGQTRKVEFAAPALDAGQFTSCACVRELLRRVAGEPAPPPVAPDVLDLRGAAKAGATDDMPGVVLVDARTAGPAEAAAARARQDVRALVVGSEATRGGVTVFSPRTVVLPDGGEFTFPAAVAGVAEAADGVAPDVRVPADLSYAAAWIAGRDPVREAAKAAVAARSRAGR